MAPTISLLVTLLLCHSQVLLGFAQEGNITVINIVEEQPEGTLVFDINTISTSGSPFVHADKKPLYNTHFEENLQERWIRTKGSFDRELMVDQKTAPDPVCLTLSIYLNGKIHTVKVNIVDINDNKPEFEIDMVTNLTSYTRSYNEGGPSQADLFRTEAVDYDEGINGTTEYILEQSSPQYFNLSFEYTPSGRVAYVFVTRILPFDKELYDNHTFTITALEGTANPSSSTLHVTIHINDIDDFPPEFIPSFYSANISEASPTGEFLVKLNVYDPDLGSNAAVSFEVSELCGQETDSTPCFPMNVASSPFTLDSDTGILTLSGDLDHESTVKYVLTVLAQNPNNIAGGSTTAIISVEVEDVNDEAPTISPYNAVISILESTQVYSGQPNTGFVDEFTVQDADSEMYSEFTVELLDSETMMQSSVFGLQNNGIYKRIILLQKVDRETKDRYDIIVQATDLLDPSLSTEVNITILISDVNDNPPVFYPQPSPVTVTENSGIGTSVLSVNASDADIGLNAKIQYSLPENSADFPNQSLFDIEPATGLITVGGTIDYEVVKEIQLMVVARDVNGEGMSAELVLNIVVMDVNDNLPVIDPAPSSSNVISEDTDIGTVIIDVDATDVDTNTVFQYSLISVPNIPLPFAIDDQGQITVTDVLDRETRESYQFKVEVFDGSYTVQSDIISVVLKDVNDSPPVFEETLLFANVQEDADSTDPPVATVTATDDDTTELTTLSYTIVAGNHGNHFEITLEGDIIVISPLDWEADMSYSLEVQASDGTLTSIVNAIVNITVIDVNDEIPAFTKSQYVFSVPEGNAVNIEVGMVEAISIEQGDNGETLYSFIGGSGLPFVIDEPSGQINVTQTLDREAKSFYTMTVKVQDVAPPAHFSTAKVNITVLDINDNPPVFAVPSLSLNLTEKTVKGDVVFVAEATDDDLAPNSVIEYSVSDNGGYFSISPNTGKLKLQNSLDYDETPSVVLIITATDPSKPEFTDTLTLSITVIEDEDSNKTFPDYFPTQLSISEDTPPSTPLIEFSGADQHGVPIPDLNYFLTHENGSEVEEFGISKDPVTNNATIHTTVQLDREQVPVYTLKIAISCTHAPQSIVAQILTIDLLDVNDNRPVFEAPSYQLFVYENEPGTATIQSATDITVFDPDNGVNGSVTFSLKTPSSYFGLKPIQGSKSVSVYQLQPLDREEMAQHSITIVTTDGGNPPQLPSEVVVTINVLDKNDNSPSFSPIFFTISENKPVGYIVGTVMASDPDEGSNAQVTFHVEVMSNAISNFNLYPNGTIQVINTPDYEVQSEYVFFVTAEDGGTPSRSTFGNVTIRVEDVNDHCPKFTGGPNFVIDDFAESSVAGTLVIDLEAKDPDTGPAGEVQYAFANVADRHLFFLDYQSGELTLVEKLDYERVSQHVIEIVAYDQGMPINHVCNATVTINVLNVNEHVPAFDNPVYEILVDENAPAGVIANLSAYDMDADSTITYSISELEPGNGNMFTVVNSKLLTIGPLNYESKSMYLLLVNATDGLYVDQVEYVIYVKNVNDNDPEFNETSYSGFISELANQGTPVLAVKATDADNNTNAAVLYSITTDNSTGMFSIDAHTGLISVEGLLDYEQATSYALTVTATDTGAVPRSSSATVTIKIIGENEFSPVFAQSTYVFAVTEESDTVDPIGQVFANDEDDGEGGVISYSFLEPTDYFTIDPTMGTIHPAKPIDRESTPTLPSLTVQASDSSMTDIATVEIMVLDINDNPPVFASSVFDFEIYDSHVPLAAIGTAPADDSDLSPNNVVNYTISPETLFTIGSSSGELSLLQMLPGDPQNSYDLTVTATDAGNAAFASTATVRIHVVGDNDHPPTFDSSIVSVNVTEGTIPVEPIATLSANDDDTDANGILNYSILGGYTQFSIDSDGDLSVVQALDYEESSNYVLTVMVSDSTSPEPRTATSTVVVNVVNTNDNNPEFTSYPSAISLSPVPFTGVRLFQVTASDQDGDSVSYVVISQTSTFGIDPTSGWVVNKQALSSPAMYSVEIQARDPEFKLTSITVEVSIAAPGSGAPSFSSNNPLPIDISESESVDKVIQTFSALGGTSEFYLVCCGEDMEPFLLNKDTGVLTLAHTLDYETKTQYQLIVEARTMPSEGTRYSDYMQVDVTVQNVNEYAPVFGSILNPIPIQENSAGGSLLTQVTATDDDIGTFGNVIYEIVGDKTGALFQINSTNGAITVSDGVVLDRETMAEYTLQVKAVDGGGLLTTAEVEVTILDENDSPPTFPQNYSIGVYEPGSVGDLVFTVQAEDADSGSQITYSLGIIQAFKGTVGEDSVGSFEITGSTGEIRLTTTLDRDKIDRYMLPVTASDDKHSTITEIQVLVVDINDNMPSFTASHYTVKMEELKAVGMSLEIPLKASDIDAGANGIVTYSLGEGWPENKFTIDPHSGKIRVKEPIGYFDLLDSSDCPSDEDPNFEGTVIATDSGDSPNSASVTVSVIIMDINDNPPLIEGNPLSFKVSRSSSVDHVIADLIVTDADCGPNVISSTGIPEYYTQPSEMFGVDGISVGHYQLKVNAALTEGIYRFRFNAYNNNPYPIMPFLYLGSFADIKVEVLPDNEHTPVFVHDMYQEVIYEGNMPEVIVLNVKASDDDLGETGRVSYSLGSTDVPFEVDEDTGEIIVLETLDREQIAVYQFSVIATDHGYPVKSSETNVTIYVLDINDNPPRFLSTSYEGQVQENSELGTFVLKVEATDLDIGEAAIVRYLIPTEDESLPFTIDPVGGEITTRGMIDYEKTTTYWFTVNATNMLNSPMCSSVSVGISVLGVNEFAPRFPSDVSYVFDIPTGATKGHIIGKVNATDEDGGKDGVLVYHINTEGRTYFNITSDSNNVATIYLNISPQQNAIVARSPRKREAEDISVTATITASDTGLTPQSATVLATMVFPSDFFSSPTPAPSEATIIYTIVGVVTGVCLLAIAIVMVCIVVSVRVKSRKGKVEFCEQTPSPQLPDIPGNTEQVALELRHVSQPDEINVYTEEPTAAISMQTQLPRGRSSRNNMGEVDYSSSGNHDLPQSPNHQRPSPHTRSTSDLASTVATDILTQDTVPYNKAQIEAIYAANANLLNDGSQDSVHMFGSEGGGEADGDVDIDNMVFTKYDLDTEGSVAGGDDISYCSKRRSTGSMTFEGGKESEYHFSQSTNPWSSRPGSISRGMNDVGRTESSRPMMYHHYEMSQGPSAFGASTQGSSVSLLRSQRRYCGSNGELHSFLPPSHPLPPPVDYFPEATLAAPLPAISSLGPTSHAHSLAHQSHHHNPHQYNLPHSRPSYQYRPSPMTDYSNSGSDGPPPPYFSQDLPYGLPHSYGQTSGHYFHGHQTPPPERCLTPQRPLRAYDNPMLSNSSNSLSSTNNSHRGGSRSFNAVESFH